MDFKKYGNDFYKILESDNAIAYRVESRDWENKLTDKIYYEVGYKLFHSGKVLPSGKVVPPGWDFPNAKRFGYSAWTTPHRDRAVDLFISINEDIDQNELLIHERNHGVTK